MLYAIADRLCVCVKKFQTLLMLGYAYNCAHHCTFFSFSTFREYKGSRRVVPVPYKPQAAGEQARVRLSPTCMSTYFSYEYLYSDQIVALEYS